MATSTRTAIFLNVVFWLETTTRSTSATLSIRSRRDFGSDWNPCAESQPVVVVHSTVTKRSASPAVRAKPHIKTRQAKDDYTISLPLCLSPQTQAVIHSLVRVVADSPTARPLPPPHALILVYEPKYEYKDSSLTVRTSPNKQLLSSRVGSVWLHAGGEPDQTTKFGCTLWRTNWATGLKQGSQAYTLKLKCNSVALLLQLHRRPPSAQPPDSHVVS